MIASFFDWCGRNIEGIIWFNVGLLVASAADQLTQGNLYPMGLCILLLVAIGILRKQ
jgi:hypothetical protein